MPDSSAGPLSSVPRVILVAELVVALVTGAGVALTYRHLDSNITAGPTIEHHNAKRSPDGSQPHEPLNVLIMGNDTRACSGCQVDGEAGGGVSDTTILLHVAADRESAYAISVPRDLLVDRPDCTVDGELVAGGPDELWNAAFARGGPECTVEQFESVFAPVYVDECLTIDFAGFKDMVDAINGVDVCIPEPLDDPKYLHAHFDAGPRVHLDGVHALVDLARQLKDADLTHVRLVTMPSFLHAPGTAGYPHVGLGPSYEKLIHHVYADAPLGSFVRDSLSADGPKKHASQAREDAAAAAGICA
jgi:LCP family protein required for cell wall assembly